MFTTKSGAAMKDFYEVQVPEIVEQDMLKLQALQPRRVVFAWQKPTDKIWVVESALTLRRPNNLVRKSCVVFVLKQGKK